MSVTPRVAVIGAGIVGLATTAALLDAGAEVRIYEHAMPGSGQSVGRTRVFRLAHGDARLVDLAARSERLWRAWEARFRRRLVGDEGLIITGHAAVAAWTEAMVQAGARHEHLSITEARARLPLARPTGEVALFDPAAGATRARRTVECLQTVVEGCLDGEEVVRVSASGSASTVATSSSSRDYDEVIITAGTATGQLAAPLGIGRSVPLVHDSRFTFATREGLAAPAMPCWFDTSGIYGPGWTSYGQPVGSTGLYAVAVGSGDAAGLPADEELALHRETAARYLPQAYPGLDPRPVDAIQCTYADYGIRDDGDGFLARRSGGVTALYGNNLFKFAPLLGELLCRTALTGSLPEELTFAGAAD